MQPKISVITVVRNGIDYIAQTIQSVINQTYSYKEYIIIDGNSMDGTVDIIQKYNKKIDKYVSEPDNGLYDAMNKGIDLAIGDWIIFMNCGDFFYDNNVLAEVFSDTIADGIVLISGRAKVRSSWGEFYLKQQTQLWKSFSHQSIFSRTDINRKYKFNLDFKVGADYNFIYTILSEKYNILITKSIIANIMYIPSGFGAKNINQSNKDKLKSIILHHKDNSKFIYHYAYHWIRWIRTAIGEKIDKYCPSLIHYIRIIRDSRKRLK